jgi:hypothetical protein
MILSAWFEQFFRAMIFNQVARGVFPHSRSSDLFKASSNLLEFFTRESSHSLRTDTTLRNCTENEASRCLVIGSFSNHHVIILAQYQVEANQFSPNLLRGHIEGS